MNIRIGYIHITGTLVGLNSHVRASLDIILPAKRIYSHTSSSDVASYHGKLCDHHNGKCSLVMLSDT